MIKNEFSWSISRNKVFQTCPRQYYFNYYGYWGGWELDAAERTKQRFGRFWISVSGPTAGLQSLIGKQAGGQPRMYPCNLPVIHPKVKMVRDKVIAYGDNLCNHSWVIED
jgi:hypothetical protein